jgi:ribosomal RNA assembly protein
MEEIIKVSHNRLPVIIGPDGSIKKKICKEIKTNLDIDSYTGEIIISTDVSFFEIHLAKNIITAIARGFSPENAFKLLEDDVVFDIIYLDDFVTSSKKRHTQIKGRVIGREGKIKNMIENRLNCKLAIYGKTVSIISNQDDMKNIKSIIEQILSGARHSTVFKSLKQSEFKSEGYKPVKEKENIDDITFTK